MTTYIVACDYDEYWMPIAATNDEETAKRILEAASQHIVEKLRAKHAEVNDGDDSMLPFDEDAAESVAAAAVIIAAQHPPFVEAGAPVVPDEVIAALDEQISEYELLSMWL